MTRRRTTEACNRLIAIDPGKREYHCGLALGHAGDCVAAGFAEALEENQRRRRERHEEAT